MPFENSSGFLSLPPELLLNVLLFVETPYLTEVVRLTHISSTVRQLVLSTSSYFKVIRLEQCYKSQSLHYTALLGFFSAIKCKDAITEADLSRNDMIGPRFLCLLLDRCPNLKRLNIENCRGFSLRSFMTTVRPWAQKRIAQINQNRRSPLSLESMSVYGVGGFHCISYPDLLAKELRVSNRDVHKAYGSSEDDSPEIIKELQELLNDLAGGCPVSLNPSLCPNCKERTFYCDSLVQDCDYCKKSLALFCYDCSKSAYLSCPRCVEVDSDTSIACLSCGPLANCPHTQEWNCRGCVEIDGCEECTGSSHTSDSDSEQDAD
jgi:hypothetical protein